MKRSQVMALLIIPNSIGSSISILLSQASRKQFILGSCNKSVIQGLIYLSGICNPLQLHSLKSIHLNYHCFHHHIQNLWQYRLHIFQYIDAKKNLINILLLHMNIGFWVRICRQNQHSLQYTNIHYLIIVCYHLRNYN